MEEQRAEGERAEGLPIPDIFLNSDTKGPLTNCVQCDYDLMKGDRYYMIEKVFKKYPSFQKTEVLFEYAVCSTCYENMKDQMSAESMANLSEYMMMNTDFGAMQLRIQEFPDDPEKWLSHCMIKGTPKEEMTEFQMGACFKGDRLVTNFMPPFMIGELAMEEMNNLLSKETKDEMDDFMGENFGIPPELRKDLILI
ncbi:hypothetical protein BFP97_00565 [Roseivirga sp. 4D4]|uniref:hypothetical protein n=1 Tax=Roseivirga sp. 4D4 TaxID=1889784 RepID=UPI000852BBE3|nr:hypothetical protein [Roseivirga sp. 4D4]OEK00097.1 hypothetical protein BFP97_00565 [Roseivirga sp. 4D4]